MASQPNSPQQDNKADASPRCSELLAPTPPHKGRKAYRIFEQMNLARLKECSETFIRAKALIKESKLLVAGTKGLNGNDIGKDSRKQCKVAKAQSHRHSTDLAGMKRVAEAAREHLRHAQARQRNRERTRLTQDG